MKRYYMLLAMLPLFVSVSTTLRADEKAKDAAAEPQITLTTGFDYITVKGDRSKFREDNWRYDGWTGGLEDFTWHRALAKDWTVDLDGHAIFGNNDYKVELQLAKPEVGFAHVGFREFRKYFDGTGGYFPLFPAGRRAFDNGQNEFLTIGDLCVDFGLTLPDLPKLTLGYERQYKEGIKSMVEWGSVNSGSTTRNIYPAFKTIDETVDIFKLAVEHDIKKVHVGDEFRFEHYRNTTFRLDDAQLNVTNATTVPTRKVLVDESFSHDAFYNAFHMDCQANEKFYWSLGYMFNSLEGGAGYDMDTQPFNYDRAKRWETMDVELEQDSHVVNGNIFLTPHKTLSFYGGLQYESAQTRGFMEGEWIEFLGGVTNAPEVEAFTHKNQETIEGTAGGRFTAIPFTTIYAEGKWQKETINLNEDNPAEGAYTEPPSFHRNTETEIGRRQFTVGLSCSPIKQAVLSAQYRHGMRDNRYNHTLDINAPGNEYSAFITAQSLESDEITTKLTLRPCSKLSVSFKYQLVTTDINTSYKTTAGVQSDNYDLNIYSVSATVTPVNRLYLTGLFSLQDTRTIAFANNIPQVTPYLGNVWSVVGSAGYALDNKTDLTATYSYSRADGFRNNSANTLSYGTDNDRHALQVGLSRRIRENITAQLRYGYYEMNESSSGGVDNYQAHQIGASCTIKY